MDSSFLTVAFLTACGRSTASENESYSSEIAPSAEEEEGKAQQAEEQSEDSPGESEEEYEEEAWEFFRSYSCSDEGNIVEIEK